HPIFVLFLQGRSEDFQRLLPAEERCDRLRMANGGREPDSLEATACDLAQTLEGNCELTPTTIFRKLMHFIHDDKSHVLQMPLHHFPGENCLERFWRRDEDVRWIRGLLPPLRLRCVAVADGGSQLRRRDEMLDAVNHVSVQGAKWTNVYCLNATSVARFQ